MFSFISKYKNINNIDKEYNLPIITVGLSLIFLFVYLFKRTTFFVEPVAVWKYFLIVLLGLIFGIPLQISLGKFLEHHLQKLSVSKDKAENISLAVTFIFYGILYFLVTK